MVEVIEFIKGFDLHTLIMIIVVGYFYKINIDNKFKEVHRKFDLIIEQLNNMNTRLSRLEGAFYERGYWESRKTGTEQKEG